MQKTIFLNSKRLLYVALLLWQATAFAQVPPAITWQKSLGGSGYDVALSIHQTTDGGYIAAGYSDSQDGDVTGNHGDRDAWIVKLDANSNLTWQKSLGGSSYDAAYSIQQTTDGGYIIAGVTASNDGDITGGYHGGGDIWVVKLDVNGNLSWQKCLGGSSGEEAYYIQQTTDGGYIVAGYSDSQDGDVTGNHGYDYWIVKLDSSGNLSWQKCLGGTYDDWATSIQQTTDGGYIVAGYSQSIDGDVTENHGYADYWILKLDVNGILSWQKSLGGSDDDMAYSVEQTTDGGYIVAGSSGSYGGNVSGNHGGTDYWVVKLNANGYPIWQKCLGGSGYDAAYSIQQTTDGGYIIAGVGGSNTGDVTGNHGGGDYWVVKLATNGTLSWQKSLGGSGEEQALSIQQTTDGGYIVAGGSRSINGDVSGNQGGWDCWVVKLGGFGVYTEEEISNKKISVYPNPVRDILNIESEVAQDVVVLNIMGEVVMGRRIIGKGEFDVSALPTGVYWLRDIDSGSGVKFVKE